MCDPCDFKKLPRQWLINLIYTVVGQIFSNWVYERIEARNRKLVEESNMAINLDPEIARCFEQATAVSSKISCILYLSHVFLTKLVCSSQPLRATLRFFLRPVQNGGVERLTSSARTPNKRWLTWRSLSKPPEYLSWKRS